MKKKIISLAVMMLLIVTAWAQTDDKSRMERDIKVAEDVLSSLIKQKYDRNSFFPVSVEGVYRKGHGVTLTVPNCAFCPLGGFSSSSPARVYRSGDGFTYSITTGEDGEVESEEIMGGDELADRARAEEERELAQLEQERAEKRAQERSGRNSSNSAGGSNSNRSRNGTATVVAKNDKNEKEQNKLLIEAAKDFLTDYSSIFGAIAPEEKILITNRSSNGNQDRFWRTVSGENPFVVSVEASGADIKQYQTGKLNREQFIAKIKVLVSELSTERSQDLELLTTIFERLYDSDLSKTYYGQGEMYYDRLNDYGAIYYMKVYSSMESKRGYFNMPTLELNDVPSEERNKKVTELYPKFEKELKDNILEYGRTIKSLKPEEVLVFNVQLTKCKGCGIPSTLEITTKASVLSDYLMGKIEKSAALAKMDVKKGDAQ